MKAAIYPWKASSEGAQILAEYLEGRLINRISDLRSNEILINWGAGGLSIDRWNSNWLNKPSAVCRAVDKLSAFDFFNRTGVPYPLYTTSGDQAKRWLHAGHIVLARQTATGMMGQGISVLTRPTDRIPSAVFYSRHVHHHDEYRIHVFRGRVINIGMKIAEVDNPNLLVRNWGNEWKFCNRDAPSLVKQIGIDAVRALGLDFGAADIGYCGNGTAYVFEVNSAPGTGHNTITRYANAMRIHMENCE